ncbi:MAG: SpoIID/LytB domain-containing protein, partial [Thermodesulfobacteriota bacterium]
SVKSPKDRGAPRYSWSLVLKPMELKKALGAGGVGGAGWNSMKIPASVEITRKTATGRVKELTVRDIAGREARLSGEELRKIVGYNKLRSTLFTVIKEEGVLTGQGDGFTEVPRRVFKTYTKEEKQAYRRKKKAYKKDEWTKERGGRFVFTGNGSGHGVGLSQWGAKGMAASGSSYKSILNHYYPGTRLTRIY